MIGRRDASKSRIVGGYYAPDGLVVIYQDPDGSRREKRLGRL